MVTVVRLERYQWLSILKSRVGGGIKLGDFNVGRAGNILTLPFYMAFLLTAY